MKIICYLSGGYPTMDESIEAAKIYADGGCDAIEWNFPPENPYMESEHIARKMEAARAQCHDYNVYMESLQNFVKSYPHIQIILMLYRETILEIGIQELVQFCQRNKITTIISADMHDIEIQRQLSAVNIDIAPFVSFEMNDVDVEAAVRSKSFVYMQAMPRIRKLPGDFDPNILPNCITTLRDKGCICPIYCGGGIRSTEDLQFLKQAGADGCFLGDVVMQYYREPFKMLEVIGLYKRAALEF